MAEQNGKREKEDGKGEEPAFFTPVKDSKMAKYQELVEWAQKQMAQPIAIIPEDDEHQLEIIEAETNN